MPSWRERFLVSLGPGLFAGITFGDWLRLLSENHFAVSSSHVPRAGLITVASLVNSGLRWYEDNAYGHRLRGLKLQPPIFILGHWRSGTTHLHNFFTVDPRFAYANLYQVNFPHTFLSTERVATRLMSYLLPARRLKDDVRQHLAMANEDELAACATTFLSPYLGSAFPEREAVYDRYLTFDGVPASEIGRWKTALVRFLKKLALKYERPIVLKSPPHTCRIKLLLEAFPDARFIHIHRNPYDVFQSTRRQHEPVAEYFRLQRQPPRDLDAMIIRRYREMYDKFFAERGLVPRDRFHELSFEELEKDPMGQLRLVYERLQLPDFEAVRKDLQHYVDGLAGYRKNVLGEVGEPLRSEIRRAWRRCFEEWQYAT
jgi:hypothetical protein